MTQVEQRPVDFGEVMCWAGLRDSPTSGGDL